MSAEEVAAFYRDPENLPRIRYSMILFNWFAVGLIPILALIVLQMRRMAHRTPIFSYAIIACAAGGPRRTSPLASCPDAGRPSCPWSLAWVCLLDGRRRLAALPVPTAPR